MNSPETAAFWGSSEHSPQPVVTTESRFDRQNRNPAAPFAAWQRLVIELATLDPELSQFGIALVEDAARAECAALLARPLTPEGESDKVS